MKITNCSTKYLKNIYFFEVNTKYISWNVMKMSATSRVRSTSENVDYFNTRYVIFLGFTEKKSDFFFILFFFKKLLLCYFFFFLQIFLISMPGKLITGSPIKRSNPDHNY